MEIGNCNDYTIKAVVIIIRYSQFSYPDSLLPIPYSLLPTPCSLKKTIVWHLILKLC
ncbi:MAG: hypothetical protein F6J94_21430 [Moorea sp. SIO1F2]|uniref:hypothetical protein n=1 Tax=Moorena sp. SIO1F2 TaxID=2607819 RepID=UPI0013B7D001|nr:hypothetical protein [Moorena sp. SIO1F2]NET84382.1 hypothetical protein [Moorena sp. SIO1F2]